MCIRVARASELSAMHILRMLRSPWVLLLAPSLLLAACAGDETRDAAAEVSRRQAGDTLIVRTRGDGRWGSGAVLEPLASFGSATGDDTTTLGRISALAVGADGRVYATDASAKVVRVFDSLLRPLGLWGREGSGPGELRSPDGGLAVFADGRVAVRDPGNARLQLFDTAGRSAGEWRVIDPGLRTRDNFAQHGDTLLSRVVVDASGPIDSWRYGLARIAPDGRVLDTLALPLTSRPAPTLVARSGNNTAELPLPFAATSRWAWHSAGGFATADGARYAITWPAPRGVVRVERDVQSVPVSDAEAAQERAYVTKGLQWLDPSWTWTGPDLPSTKPLLSGLFTGTDGSVWVLREGAAVERDDPDHRPTDPSSVERRLRSRLTFEVFDGSGTLLGVLPVPEGMQLRPQPVVREHGLVAITIDADGVPRLVRYRMGRPSTIPPSP